MNDRTHFEHSGLIVIVTPEQAAAATDEHHAIWLSIREAFPLADIGIVPDALDLTFDSEGTYHFAPLSEMQEALEGFERGERIAPGRYAAHRRFDERDE